MAYVMLDKMPEQQRNEVLKQAQIYLNTLEEL
jgi:hypothetical protein